MALALNRFQTETKQLTTADQTIYTAPNGAYAPMDGKLVLETGDSLVASAGANSTLKVLVSVLETANA